MLGDWGLGIEEMLSESRERRRSRRESRRGCDGGHGSGTVRGTVIVEGSNFCVCVDCNS